MVYPFLTRVLSLWGLGWAYQSTDGQCSGIAATADWAPMYPQRRKRSTNPQQDENFIAALEAVRTGGLGFCKAAKIYGVNNRTLWLEYRKRGYPIMRPSTKSKASLDHACAVQKIKLPPLPTNPVNQQPAVPDVTNPIPTQPSYDYPLYNFSTLWQHPPLDIAKSNLFIAETFMQWAVFKKDGVLFIPV